MLVLTRKRNEQIVIDGDIKVTIVKIHSNRVLIGIDAPEQVPVHRREIVEQFEAASAAGAYVS
jgi:carbon storage regulator